MSVTKDQIEPNIDHEGASKVGTATNPYGEGHFTALSVGGVPAAPLDSPAFTGAPTVPTQAAGDNSTKAASTAYADAGATAARARANHTGTQSASTISDFSTAVAATASGAQSHIQNSDTILDEGEANEVTATDLRSHLDDDAKHREIDDSSNASTDLWSAYKIAMAIAAAQTASNDRSNHTGTQPLNTINGVGNLAALDTVDTAQIDDDAVTSAKVEGGEAAPAANHYWGTESTGSVGFHSIADSLPLKTTPGSGEAALDSDSDGVFVPLGTTATTAASGADSRFPSVGEKDAFTGTAGSPSSTNRYVTDSDARLLTHNFNGNGDPSAFDDSAGLGGNGAFGLGSLWFQSNSIHICTRADPPGAATWEVLVSW